MTRRMTRNDSDITILFVDDEREVLNSIQRLLIREPYAVLFAQGAEEALALLSSRSVDIVVSDIRMPDMDGLSLLEAIREKYPDVIRMILSAGTEIDTLLDAINKGRVFRFIPKPIDDIAAFQTTLNQAADQCLICRHAREADRMKSEFAASVSHEFRSPLACIKGFASTILREPEMEAKTRQEFLEIINHECERLSHLIETILDLSAIESGVVHLNIGSIHLNEVTREVVDMLRPASEKADVRIAVQTADNLALIEADRDRTFRLIYNLISNAIKFTPRRGSVDVEVNSTQEGICLRVRDTGIGMPQGALAHVCERFYRVHREGTEFPGTGLGLSLVKQTVEKHGWTLEFESREGEGTTVTLNIPLDLGPTEEI